LLRQVSPLLPEQPEDILRLFVRLGEIHDLGLVPDRIFITRILPLVSGSLLQFLGTCLREGRSWVACKSQLLEEYFPHFVLERLVRDIIVFNFQGERQSMRVYVEQVFQAANFLHYGATEEQLVDRVVMNFHPDVLNQAAVLDRPRSLGDLRRVAGLVEEKFSVLKERRRLDPGVVKGTDRGAEYRGTARNIWRRAQAPTVASTGYWGCGEAGHFRMNCPQKKYAVGKRAASRRSGGPRAKFLSSVQKIGVYPADPPLWVMLKLKVGKVPALVDTGAQFSCVRAEVAEFLYLTGEPCNSLHVP
jgi:hypothetical protein